MTAKKLSIDSKKRVILVDDHPMMRQGIAQLINEQIDLEVCCEAGNAPDAMKFIECSQPDLAIVDVSLDGSSGLELIKDLRERHPDVLVLVLSMHEESVYAERMLSAGARGYIMKNAGGGTVLAAIRQVFGGGVYLSEKMSARVLNSLADIKSQVSQSPIKGLTDREFEVFELLGEGKTTLEIALQLHLSPKTVDAHRRHIKQKLQMKTATALVRYAVRWIEAQNAGMTR
jgi:DNA-binding NarL/FixJ family response regulator